MARLWVALSTGEMLETVDQNSKASSPSAEGWGGEEVSDECDERRGGG